jgi:hypothetical protein
MNSIEVVGVLLQLKADHAKEPKTVEALDEALKIYLRDPGKYLVPTPTPTKPLSRGDF